MSRMIPLLLLAVLLQSSITHAQETAAQPQEAGPEDEVAPQELAPQELAPQELAPQELAPQELAPQEVAVLPARLVLSLDSALAERAATLRLEMREEKITEGAVLLSFAGASVLGGAATAIVGLNDFRLLSAGLASAGWGLVNGVLALFLLDLSQDSLNAAQATRLMTGERLFADIDGLARDQGGSALIFAVNTGIDVGYVATGLLIALLGFNARPEDQGLIGYGLAQAAQGLGLFAFDLACWVRSSERQGSAQRLLTPAFEE